MDDKVQRHIESQDRSDSATALLCASAVSLHQRDNMMVDKTGSNHLFNATVQPSCASAFRWTSTVLIGLCLCRFADVIRPFGATASATRQAKDEHDMAGAAALKRWFNPVLSTIVSSLWCRSGRSQQNLGETACRARGHAARYGKSGAGSRVVCFHLAAFHCISWLKRCLSPDRMDLKDLRTARSGRLLPAFLCHCTAFLCHSTAFICHSTAFVPDYQRALSRPPVAKKR